VEEIEPETATPSESEWRIHFHIPLHSPPTEVFENTTDQLLQTLDFLQTNPDLCSHLEMETYTWEVLPPELKHRDVVEQLVAEYEWTLGTNWPNAISRSSALKPAGRPVVFYRELWSPI